MLEKSIPLIGAALIASFTILTVDGHEPRFDDGNINRGRFVSARWSAPIGSFESAQRGGLKRFGLQVKRRVDPNKTVSDTAYTRISEAMIERILKGMKYDNFQRKQLSKSVYYSFRNKDNRRVRLWLLFDHTNIMMSADFPEASLTRLNNYNSAQLLVRAVQYQDNQGKYTSFESNLSCSNGVTETMIRYFINRFDFDVRRFADELFNGKQN